MSTRTTKTLLFMSIIALVVTVSGNAMAWGPGGCGKGYAKGCCRNSTDGPGGQWAGLDKDQQSQIKDLHQKFIDETADARASIIAQYDAARVLLGTSEPDRAKLVAISNDISELSKTVMEKRIDFALAAKQIAPDFRLPFEFKGEGRFHGMGMGNFDMDNRCDGCPKAMGYKGRFCRQKGFVQSGQAVLTGCPGIKGCQSAPAGCPGLTQSN